MDTSPRFGLPMIMASQAQKHLTHNEALAQLEMLVQPVVSDLAALTPSLDPDDGDCMIVGTGASDAFAGQDQNLAALIGQSWQFFVPQAGWMVIDGRDGKPYVYDGAAWVPLPAGVAQNDLPYVGINAQASASTRLTVASDASLFYAQTNDHRLTINKAGPTDTASMVFQSGWSGRAEMGLAGHDGFAIKVSADGSNWAQALSIDPASGVVSQENCPIVRASLFGATTSFPAARQAGFDAPSLSQGGFSAGSALTAPALGQSLLVPANGLYQLTLSLNVSSLGDVSLLRNGSALVASFKGSVSGPVRSVQFHHIVDLEADDALTLRFDDAATCLCDESAVELVRL